MVPTPDTSPGYWRPWAVIAEVGLGVEGDVGPGLNVTARNRLVLPAYETDQNSRSRMKVLPPGSTRAAAET